MATPEELEIHRRLYESQEKYTYFLLAAVGACLGFALTQTNEIAISTKQIPLAIAVLMWGLSFFYGCKYLQAKQSTTYANSEYLKAENGHHPISGFDPVKIDVVLLAIEQNIHRLGTSSSRYRTAQFCLLISAVAFYVIWHILEMWERAVVS